MDKYKKWIFGTSNVLTVVGALNWGLVGFFRYNFVEAIFGTAAPIVYGIVGIAAVFTAIDLFMK